MEMNIPKDSSTSSAQDPPYSALHTSLAVSNIRVCSTISTMDSREMRGNNGRNAAEVRGILTFFLQEGPEGHLLLLLLLLGRCIKSILAMMNNNTNMQECDTTQINSDSFTQIGDDMVDPSWLTHQILGLGESRGWEG